MVNTQAMLEVTTSKETVLKFLYVKIEVKDGERKFGRIKKMREIISHALKKSSIIRKDSCLWKRPPLTKQGYILSRNLK